MRFAFGALFVTRSLARSGNATGYAKFYGRSHYVVIRTFDDARNVVDGTQHAGEFKELRVQFFLVPGVCSLVTSRN